MKNLRHVRDFELKPLQLFKLRSIKFTMCQILKKEFTNETDFDYKFFD